MVLQPVQLLLAGLHRLVILEDALPGLVVVALDLLHLAGHALDHFRLPLSQLLHLGPVIGLQLFLQLPHFELVLLLLLHPDVGDLEISNSSQFVVQLLLVTLVDLGLVLLEADFAVFDSLEPHEHLLLVGKVHLAQPILQVEDGLVIIGLNGDLGFAFGHSSPGHGLLHDGLKERFLGLEGDFEHAGQLFVREVMFGVAGFGRENCEGVEVALVLEVLGDEGVANLLDEGGIGLGLGGWFGVFELVYYLFAQLELDVVDQLIVLTEGVEQLFFVEVLFVHFSIITKTIEEE